MKSKGKLVLKLIGFFMLGVFMFNFLYIPIGGLIFVVFMVWQGIMVFVKNYPFKPFIIPIVFLVIFIVTVIIAFSTAQQRYDICVINSNDWLFALDTCERRIESSLYSTLKLGSFYGGLSLAAIWYSDNKKYKKMMEDLENKN